MTAMKSIYLTHAPEKEASPPAESVGYRKPGSPGALVMPRSGKGGAEHDAP